MKNKLIICTILFSSIFFICISYSIRINKKSNSSNSSDLINSSTKKISDKENFEKNIETISDLNSLNNSKYDIIPKNSYTSDLNSTKENITSPDKKIFQLQLFLSNLQCNNYILKSGETLSTIAHKYENTCNPNTTVKLISLINNLNTPNDLEIGTNLSIPESTIKNGILYHVVSDDTWYKLASEYYPDYTTESIMNFLVTINNLPNNDLPLGENVFLPLV